MLQPVQKNQDIGTANANKDEEVKGGKFLNIDDSVIKQLDVNEESGDEEEEEDAESIKNMFNVEAEDIHLAQK